ncbi:MAG: glycosyltransferase family 4 protein, partial [Gemmatimonadales bacterium]
ARVVRRERPDIIHSHNSSPLVAAAWATLVAPGTRLIHTEHGRSTTRSLLARVALRLASRRASIVVAVSNDTAAWARRHGGMPADRIRVVRNGVAIEIAPPSRPPGRRHAVTVARIEKVKDLATMIHAAVDIVKLVPDFHLHIVGDGTERSSLTALAAALGMESHITFHGVTNDVTSALAMGDIFLSSSVSEGISLTILEAMASGLPIVATAVGGTPELVEDGRNGRLVPPHRADLLATAVVNVLGDPAGAARLGRSSRERVGREFSLDVMVDSYRRLYEAM